MDYIIKNDKNVYIKLNKSGQPITCPEREKGRFEYHKAKNILKCLPKTIQRLKFKIIPIPEMVQGIEEKTIESKSYVPSDNVTQWVAKFGLCGDILTEAQNREQELEKELADLDKELLDILHIVEIENSMDLFGGWKLYKRIKENRALRRDKKDEMIIVTSVLSQIKNISKLHREHIQRCIDGLFGRKYDFRIINIEEEDNDEAV